MFFFCFFNFINNIIYLEPSARLGELDYLLDVDTQNFSTNIMFGGTIKSVFKNLDATDGLYIASNSARKTFKTLGRERDDIDRVINYFYYNV